MKTAAMVLIAFLASGCLSMPKPRIAKIEKIDGSCIATWSDKTFQVLNENSTIYAAAPQWPWKVGSQRYYSMVEAIENCSSRNYVYDGKSKSWSCK